MKTAAFLGLVLAADFLAVVFQSRCAPLPVFSGATVLIFPVILAYAALALPLYGALAVAFFNGLLWDALTIQFLRPDTGYTQDVPALPEFALGWSVVLFGVLTLLVHGLRPLFLRGRWDMHCLASGVCAILILAAEYGMISFRRGVVRPPHELVAQLLLPGFFAMLLSPVVYWAFRGIAAALGYPVRVYPEKKPRH